MDLPVKRRKFADEWIKTGNAYQSAIAAGYSKNYAKAQASKLLENVGVKAYINERMAEIDAQSIMTASEALKLLTRIARGEEMESVVVGTAQGAEIVKRPPDNKQKMAAAKELLKRFPDNDRLLDAQVRKMEAEANISEAKAKLLNDDRVALETKIVIGEYDE